MVTVSMSSFERSSVCQQLPVDLFTEDIVDLVVDWDGSTGDEANICKTENIENGLVAHPYTCSKYIDCKGPGDTFVKEDHVYDYQNGKVYDPAKGWADTPENVDCAKQIDPTLCAASPCANGGACEDTMSGFKCHCPFGQYNGQNCENKLTTCDEDITCHNGTCTNTDNGFYCNCSENYVGIYCQNQKIPCSAVTCLNGATCRDTDSGHRCECVVGFTGDKCETDIDDCVPNPCHKDYSDNQACVDKVNGYECNCLSCNCSTVITTIDCQLDVLAECKAAKAAHPGRDYFYLAHPYKCDKHIWCFSNGDNGVDVPCSTTLFFNPSYDPDKKEPCSSYTGECIES
ncbi:hypothetical protein LSAT2_024806 [Lamellibrachia satsuma]|nr:hypothetical protein LSAT2_024806 [Lamellibrachia satsuma]